MRAPIYVANLASGRSSNSVEDAGPSPCATWAAPSPASDANSGVVGTASNLGEFGDAIVKIQRYENVKECWDSNMKYVNVSRVNHTRAPLPMSVGVSKVASNRLNVQRLSEAGSRSDRGAVSLGIDELGQRTPYVQTNERAVYDRPKYANLQKGLVTVDTNT